MSDHCCAGGPKPAPRARRGLDIAGTIVPTAILVLLPKCPACIVAWLAVGTGIGVTVSTAASLRIGLLVSCLACLAYVSARHVLRAARHWRRG